MKKIILLLLVLTLVIVGSVYAFADDSDVEICEMSPEVLIRVQEIKAEFIMEKVAEKVLTQAAADELLLAVASLEHNNALRSLGFGAWVYDSKYADEILELLPHKGMSSGRGYRNSNLTDEEWSEMHDEGGFHKSMNAERNNSSNETKGNGRGNGHCGR